MDKKELTSREVAAHYGYYEYGLAPSLGAWLNDGTIPERMTHIPETLDFEKKFRVIVDYDPKYPRALIQLFTD